MKIGLLNLQYDNNYGGNLQRFALMEVLKRLGHKPIHINLRFDYKPKVDSDFIALVFKRLIMRLIKRYKGPIVPEYDAHFKYERECSITEPFYRKYIKSTKKIFGIDELYKSRLNFDCYIVGSDQVWRKKIAQPYGIKTFFFDFLPPTSKRIAYGVSFGTSETELDIAEFEELGEYYKKFSAVSVREDSGLDLLKQYNWNVPSAIQVLDPTMLLEKSDYELIIEQGKTKEPLGSLFCYILDNTKEKRQIIKEISEEKDLQPFWASLNDYSISIEQWLRSFRDSKFVVTDSYHGVVFSIIFNKEFKLIRNSFRGNARFDSLIRLLEIDESTTKQNWTIINKKVALMREKSIIFLRTSLTE